MTTPSAGEIERAVERAWEHLDAGVAREVAGPLRALLARGVADPGDRADLHHLIGLACEELGDRDGMAAAWLETLRLDRESDDETRELGTAEFERVVGDALDELPAEVLERLRNVPVIAEERPSAEMVAAGTDPRVLGLFHGVPMPDESTLGPGSVGTIHLFARNIEAVSADEADLREQIRVTVLHETAHYFGFDEDGLRRLGLD
ncbi:MAG TPA: metallopeptidase family protein [Thermoleophilia bacterium]|nr:metallopeptidase family protein [Thermoleophilia bacterium]